MKTKNVLVNWKGDLKGTEAASRREFVAPAEYFPRWAWLSCEATLR